MFPPTQDTVSDALRQFWALDAESNKKWPLLLRNSQTLRNQEKTLSKELGACSEEGTKVETSPDQHALDHSELCDHSSHLTIGRVCL